VASEDVKQDGQALNDLFLKAKALSDMPDTDVHIVELLSVYVRFVSENGFAWFLLGDALRNIGRFKEGEEALLKAVSLAPDESKFAVYARLGMLAAKRSSPSDAEEWYRLATVEPGCPGWMWCLRGANLARLEAYRLANTCLEAALKADDVDREEVFLNLALDARAQRQYQEARAFLEAALAIDANYEDARTVLQSLSDIEETTDNAASVAALAASGNATPRGE
jgi:tetratricopeptide (TPR) repeat protein